MEYFVRRCATMADFQASKFSLVSLLGLVTVFAASARADDSGAKPWVLITAFEPFAGRKINLSYEVAKRVQIEGVDIELCLLPVVYDRAAEVAEACYESILAKRAKPAFVLSMGE